MLFSHPYPALNDGSAFPPARVRCESVGATALDFFSRNYAASGTRQQWAERLARGQVVLADGAVPVTAETILRLGDSLLYTQRPWQEPEVPNYFIVLFEDEAVLVLAKPAGLQVLTRGDFCQRTVAWLLERYHEQVRRARFPTSDVPTPVHRLGRGTSGVLLCACTAAARRQLAGDFNAATTSSPAVVGVSAVDGQHDAAAQRPMGKCYRTLVSGVVPDDEGRIDVAIGRMPYAGLMTGLFAASSAVDAKPAHSLYRVLHRRPDSTLVEVTILTGRPHQIRIHMAAIGHPLVGDPLYAPGGVPKGALQQHDGGQQGSGAGAYGDAPAVMPGDCGYLLHSMQLRFVHPLTRKEVVVTAPPPDALKTPAEAAGPAAG